MLLELLLYYSLTCIFLAFFVLLGLLLKRAFLALPMKSQQDLQQLYVQQQQQIFDQCDAVARQLNRPWGDRLKSMTSGLWEEHLPELKAYLQALSKADLLRLDLGPAFPLGQRHPWSEKTRRMLKQSWRGNREELLRYLKACEELERLGRRLIQKLEKPWERDFVSSPQFKGFAEGILKDLQRLQRGWKKMLREFALSFIKFFEESPRANHTRNFHRERRKASRPFTGRQFSSRSGEKGEGYGSSASQHCETVTPSKKADSTQEIKRRIRGAKTPEEVLGVTSQATPIEIKRAYRALVKRFHPDRMVQRGGRVYAESQEMTVMINRAKADLLWKTARRKTAA